MKPFTGKTLNELLALVFNDRVLKSEAIICLTGDGLARAPKTVELFKLGLAKWIVVSGGYNNPPFSLPAERFKKELVKKGIDPKRIILEDGSQNTREQAIRVMEIVKKRKWKRIILVASHFHQPRAYLTFLKGMKEAGLRILMFNAPARDLSWFKKAPPAGSRLQLLMEELKKINPYQKKGHLVSFKEVIEYQKWKEKT